MIRRLIENDITPVMKIWLDGNINAHSFIAEAYWINHYSQVKEMLPQAEVYVYEDDITHQIVGFIGLTDHYIAGIFIEKQSQSKGIGKQLLCYVKNLKSDLCLSVYLKNERAIAFYLREQFVIQSEDTDPVNHEKEYVMIWKKPIAST